jgi:hypothetical protein
MARSTQLRKNRLRIGKAQTGKDEKDDTGERRGIMTVKALKR